MADEAQEQEAQEKPKRVRVSDEDFARVCQEVVNDESTTGSYIEEIAKRTGLKAQSVQQRRTAFNKKFEAQGIRLPELPRGNRSVNKDEVAERLRSMKLVVETPEAMQEAEETPTEAE